MKAVIQRVNHASVTVDGKIVGHIDTGLLAYIGVARDDTSSDAEYIADKIANLRIFQGADGKMNHSVTDVKGSVLAVSQFTLCGDCRKGRRPSFDSAAPPDIGQDLYDQTVSMLKSQNLHVEQGVFRAKMYVTSENDGPVTIILDSTRQL